MTTRREYGTGSISWDDDRHVRLRVRIDGKVHTKRATVKAKNHGGRGQASDLLTDYRDKLIAESEAQRGPGAHTTLAQLMERYAEHVERIGRRPSTVENYRHTSKRIVDPLASTPLIDITAHDLDTFYGSLKMAERSIRQTHAIIRAALGQAVRWGWLASNPADAATPPAKPKNNRKALTGADVAALVRQAVGPRPAGDDDPVLGMAILLAALTGLRRGELCGLRWDDITGPLMKVERQWVPGTGGQYLADPKSDGGKRTVVLGPLVLGELEAYKAEQWRRTEHEPFGWVLSHEADEKPLRAKALGDAITDIGERVGIPVTTHSFRRFAATTQVHAGVDVDTAARRMGHTREVMLGSYVLGSDERAIAAAEAVEVRAASQGLALGATFAR